MVYGLSSVGLPEQSVREGKLLPRCYILYSVCIQATLPLPALQHEKVVW